MSKAARRRVDRIKHAVGEAKVDGGGIAHRVSAERHRAVDVVVGFELPLDFAGRGVQRVEIAIERRHVDRAVGTNRG